MTEENRVYIATFKEGYETCPMFKLRVEEIRNIRNKRISETDFYLFPDIVIDENKLNTIKEYRQNLRDFMNRLMNDEIPCNMFLPDDEFEKQYMPQMNK